jgi:hypothetical protein
MSPAPPKADVARAQQIWDEYQKQHDVSDRIGQAAGIDPVSGRLWFGESIVDISKQLEAEGIARPLFFVRVGSSAYLRKGGGAGDRFCER